MEPNPSIKTIISSCAEIPRGKFLSHEPVVFPDDSDLVKTKSLQVGIW